MVIGKLFSVDEVNLDVYSVRCKIRRLPDSILNYTLNCSFCVALRSNIRPVKKNGFFFRWAHEFRCWNAIHIASAVKTKTWRINNLLCAHVMYIVFNRNYKQKKGEGKKNRSKKKKNERVSIVSIYMFNDCVS